MRLEAWLDGECLAVWNLVGKARYLIGRGEGSDIRVFDAACSRRHAELHIDEHGAVIADLSSAQGTWVDNEQLQPRTRARLQHKSKLLFGIDSAIQYIFELHTITAPNIPTPRVVSEGGQRPAAKKLDLRRCKKLCLLPRTKYVVVSTQAEALGWHALDTEEQGKSRGEQQVEQEELQHTWHVCWYDSSISFKRVMRMGRMQKINHFPGMLDLVRKTGTARHLNRMLEAIGKVRLQQRTGPNVRITSCNDSHPHPLPFHHHHRCTTRASQDFKFFPRTFMLPSDFAELKLQFNESTGRSSKTFIVKPSR